MFNSYETFYDKARKGWPFNTGDCMACLTVCVFRGFNFTSVSMISFYWFWNCFDGGGIILFFILFSKYISVIS